MTALIIVFILILLVIILLNFSLRAEIKYYDEKIDIQVKYLFIKIYPLKIKQKRKSRFGFINKKNNDDSSDESSGYNNDESIINIDEYDKKNINDSDIDNSNIQEISEEDEKLLRGENDINNKCKKSISEKFDDIMDKLDAVKQIWNSSKKGLLKLFRNIHLDNLIVDFIISDEDAYEAAMNYGKICGVTYNLISAVRLIFPISIKTVDINCNFDRKKSVYDGEITVKLTILTMLSACICILWGLYKNPVAYKIIFKKDKSGRNSNESDTVKV